MAFGNPHFIDDETGSIILLDASGWSKLQLRYHTKNFSARIEDVTWDELRVLVETIFSAKFRAEDSGSYKTVTALKSILAKIRMDESGESANADAVENSV